MNNLNSLNKHLKSENPQGEHFRLFLVGGLQYKLAYIQSDKCHSADFSLIIPNLYQSESKIICLISQRIKLLLNSKPSAFKKILHSYYFPKIFLNLF